MKLWGLLMQWGLVIVFCLAGYFTATRCFGPSDTPEGQRADTVLAEDSSFRRRQAEGDSVRAVLVQELRVSQAESRRWRDSTRALLRQDAEAQAALDSTVAAGVPDSVEPAAFWKDQFEQQRRIAASLRMQTVPAFESRIRADSLTIATLAADTTLLVRQRDEARARVARVTGALDDLREATKPGIRVLGLRLPSWTDDALEVAGTAVLAYRIGQASR